ncbi:MAG: Hsp20/alpha crystallin family protein [Actinomycetota bacterium]|jgi:HSP20 family protein
MLMRTDPFRDLDRLTQQVFGNQVRPVAMPMDAWREGDQFVVELDLPGVDPSTIDLDVERNVLTIGAERKSKIEDKDVVAAERPTGTFSRQLILGDTLDTENVSANYEAGVLALRIPIREQAKPRKIEISSGDKQQMIDA